MILWFLIKIILLLRKELLIFLNMSLKKIRKLEYDHQNWIRKKNWETGEGSKSFKGSHTISKKKKE